MPALEIAAHAKINWRLAVTGRRENGYHELMGLMQSISLCDTLYLRKSNFDSCHTEPPVPGKPQDNLAFRAWMLLKQKLGLQQCLQINIQKRIPLGGGLGGGSADAAAVLKGVNSLLKLNLSQKELQELGLKLGADIPFCLQGGLAQVKGIGEIIEPLPNTPSLSLLLVNPGIEVPTARVFEEYKSSGRGFSSPKEEEAACRNLFEALKQGDIAACNKLLANDLSESARALYPQLIMLEEQMSSLGLQPLLSGSGGTMLALLSPKEDIHGLQKALSSRYRCFMAHTIGS